MPSFPRAGSGLGQGASGLHRSFGNHWVGKNTVEEEKFGTVVEMPCYCLECEKEFTIEHRVGTYGRVLRCPQGHDSADEVAAIHPFLRRLLDKIGQLKEAQRRKRL